MKRKQTSYIKFDGIYAQGMILRMNTISCEIFELRPLTQTEVILAALYDSGVGKYFENGGQGGKARGLRTSTKGKGRRMGMEET